MFRNWRLPRRRSWEKIPEPIATVAAIYPRNLMLHVTGCPVELQTELLPRQLIPAERWDLCECLTRLDVDAWEALYVEHRRLIRGVLASHLGYCSELEDITQQVFETGLSLVQTGKVQLKGQPHGMRAWLVAIALRLARSEKRRRSRDRSEGISPGDSLTAATIDPEAWQLLQRTLVLLDRLPDRWRTPWLLRHLEGMQLEEIAASCGVSLATVKRRLSRAHKKFTALAARDTVLREHLEERGAP